MNDIFALVIILVLSAAPLVALLVLLGYLLPQRTARAQQVWLTRPGRAFWLGLINVIFFGLLAALLGQGGEFGGLLGLLILLALLALALIGLAGLLRELQARIFAEDGLATGVKTAVLLTLALLTPFAGWFILTPILFTIGLGVALLGWRQGKRPFTEEP